MGKMLCSAAADFGFEVAGGYDVVSAGGNVFDDVSAVNVPFDAVIDFSRPQTLDVVIELASTRRVPAVIATTGYTEAQKDKISALSKSVPVFYSANMSLGIAAVKAAAVAVKAVLGDDFDIEILEKHHNQKADVPSGTALLLADALCPKDKQIVNRDGMRSRGELGISSIRGGTVVGEHEIGFYGDDEIITVAHSARSRKLFAAGAFKAVEFLFTVSPALYCMDDLVSAKLGK